MGLDNSAKFEYTTLIVSMLGVIPGFTKLIILGLTKLMIHVHKVNHICFHKSIYIDIATLYTETINFPNEQPVRERKDGKEKYEMNMNVKNF